MASPESWCTGNGTVGSNPTPSAELALRKVIRFPEIEPFPTVLVVSDEFDGEFSTDRLISKQTQPKHKHLKDRRPEPRGAMSGGRPPLRHHEELTPEFVEAAPEGRFDDGNGLALFVAEDGSRRWKQQLRLRGRDYWVGLGNAAVIPLEEVRALALENFESARRREEAEKIEKETAPEQEQAVQAPAEPARRPRRRRKLCDELTVERIEQNPAGRYADGRGLHLSISPTGVRRWYQVVTSRGKTHRIDLDLYPKVSLAAARARALENWEIARAGGDLSGRDATGLTLSQKRSIAARQAAAWRDYALTLSEEIVEQAPPGRHPDGNGLALVVSNRGVRHWNQRLVIDGRTRSFGLGSTADLSLAAARELAQKNREIAGEGRDPRRKLPIRWAGSRGPAGTTGRRGAALVRRAIRAAGQGVSLAEAMTFEQAAAAVLDLHRDSWVKKHIEEWESALRRFVFPNLGVLPISKITPQQVVEVLRPIWRDRPVTAQRVRQRMGLVFRWAQATGIRPDDPAAAANVMLPRQRHQVRHFKALPHAEVREVIARVRAAPSAAAVRQGLEFLILTAARSGEVRRASWGEIDMTQRLWTVPAERMKAKRQHRVPLAPAAVALLVEAGGGQGKKPDSALLFPSSSGAPLSDGTFGKLLRSLEVAAVPHGFRTSFRTWCAEKTPFPREVAERALAHIVRDATVAAYDRSDLLAKRRELMELWSHYVQPIRRLFR